MATENLRIGVFVCDCGSNIAGPVDTETVRAYAETLAGVALFTLMVGASAAVSASWSRWG